MWDDTLFKSLGVQLLQDRAIQYPLCPLELGMLGHLHLLALGREQGSALYGSRFPFDSGITQFLPWDWLHQVSSES